MKEEITLFIEKWLCKMNLHRLTFQNGETGITHCYCYKAISSEEHSDACGDSPLRECNPDCPARFNPNHL